VEFLASEVEFFWGARYQKRGICVEENSYIFVGIYCRSLAEGWAIHA